MTTAIKPLWLQTFRIGPLSLIILGGLFSCGNLANSRLNLDLNVSSINDIQQKRQLEANVSLKGKVENRVPFLGTGAYQLQDKTGNIWVLTKQGIPQKGELILIKGLVRYKIITIKELGGQDLGEVYIEEIEQSKLTPPTNN
ncbi:MAG TPA: DNA-binding protein [Kamptonema sp.]|nr:DNA-binding protein [Kamptonema sp.]